MSAYQRMRVTVAIAAALLAFSLSSVAAQLPDKTIQVDAGKQRVITFRNPPRRVAIGDPATADVQMISASEVMITAKQPGTTNLHVWFRHETQPWEADVVVTAAIDMEKRAVTELGDQKLSVEKIGDRVHIQGASPSLEAHEQVAQMAGKKDAPALDSSTLGFDAQVQTDIKVVEISRQKLKSVGLFLGKNTGNTTAAIGPPGTLSGVDTSKGDFVLQSSAGFLPNAQAFNLVLGNSNKGLLGVISALENGGFAYTLAEPTLVSMSGQTASFLVGGEFPIPVSQGSGSSSTVTITYKEFGVRLMLTPTVLDPNRIMLKVAPEVSELDFSAGVQSGGVTVPALRIRRTDTTVQLGNGESFVISGLISQNTLSSIDKFPGLGDLPVLGAFFRSTRVQKEDKELIMIVTPHLVRALAQGATTPAIPGEKYRRYDPSFPELLFKPDGGAARLEEKGGFSE